MIPSSIANAIASQAFNSRSWMTRRVEESNGFVAKRIFATCIQINTLIYGTTFLKDGRIIPHEEIVFSGGRDGTPFAIDEELIVNRRVDVIRLRADLNREFYSQPVSDLLEKKGRRRGQRERLWP
jgi:hypothetical protein